MTRLHAESFAQYWDIHAFNDFFAARGTIALLAEMQGNAVGMIVIRGQHEQSDVMTIAVSPERRCQGIGAKLLRAAMQEAVMAGAKTLFLDVDATNEAALALYQAFGFTQISRRKLYYRQKDGSYTDALVMSLKLN